MGRVAQQLVRPSNKEYYNNRALGYAETYGILDYKVDGKFMIFNVSYPAYLSNPRYTVQHRVNLENYTSETRRLKRYRKDGEANRG